MGSDPTSNTKLLEEIALLKAQNKLLAEEIERLNQTEKPSLFDIFPIAISENDFSNFKRYLFELKESGVTNFSTYLQNHPNKREEVFKLISLVKLKSLNKEHFKLYGITIEQYVELLPLILASFTSELVDEYANQFIALAQGELEYQLEMPPQHLLSGEIRTFISFLKVAPGYEENLSKVFVVYIDITERKAALQALALNERKLQDLNADKDRFLTILAHDIKSPFQVIIGYFDILETSIDDLKIEKVKEYISNIHQSAKNTYSLLEEILLWVRANSGKIPYKPEQLKLIDLCSEIDANMRLHATNKQITITHNIPKELFVFADKNMISTVLRNLVSNAIKFTEPQGQVSIEAKENNGITTIGISDTGVGINNTVAKKLFDISHKHTSLGTNNEAGTGLGLLICKEFIENHGGTIWVESEVGMGSKFIFTLPN